MPGGVVVEFDCSVQSLSALQAATYRLIGSATCQIEKVGDRWHCHLDAQSAAPPSDLRVRFLDLVADENMRERIAAKTEPVRNLILSLAFGTLATAEKTNPVQER
jgi:His-Xaa-Ser system protein HxsD